MNALVRPKLSALWRAVQVELQGEYSTRRVDRLFSYVHGASTLRVLLVQLATPLPCLVITTLVDLIPLRPIAEGISSSQPFFLRAFISFWLANVTTYNQFKHIVPQLPLSNVKIAVYGAIIAALTVGSMYGLACAVGFPVPFSIITLSPLWLSLFTLTMAPWMIKSRSDPVAWPLVVTSIKLMVCQEVLVIVYPAYFYIFTTIPDSGKTAFALFLPALKLVLRNAMAKTVGYLHDEVPEGVILNVEVVSALFVSYCMQNTSSLNTTCVLMAADALQMLASLHDINLGIQRMEALRQRASINSEGSTQSRRLRSEFNLAQDIFKRHTSHGTVAPVVLSRVPSQILKLSATIKPFTPVITHEHERNKQQKAAGSQPLHGATATDTSTAVIPSLDDQYVLELRKVLYMTEFVVLLNYVEVVIPLIFSAYLLAVFHLPNRVYYKHVDKLDHQQLRDSLLNVLLYAGLQLVSLIVLNAVLWYKMRLSGFRQLSFVLEQQCGPVQNKLILWVFYNVQTALQHFGFDFTFQFAWLRGTYSRAS